MTKICMVSYCPTNKMKASLIRSKHFFRFPTKKWMREYWLERIGESVDKNISTNSLLCTNHFHEADLKIIKNKGTNIHRAPDNLFPRKISSANSFKPAKLAKRTKPTKPPRQINESLQKILWMYNENKSILMYDHIDHSYSKTPEKPEEIGDNEKSEIVDNTTGSRVAECDAEIQLDNELANAISEDDYVNKIEAFINRELQKNATKPKSLKETDSTKNDGKIVTAPQTDISRNGQLPATEQSLSSDTNVVSAEENNVQIPLETCTTQIKVECPSPIPEENTMDQALNESSMNKEEKIQAYINREMAKKQSWEQSFQSAAASENVDAFNLHKTQLEYAHAHSPKENAPVLTMGKEPTSKSNDRTTNLMPMVMLPMTQDNTMSSEANANSTTKMEKFKDISEIKSETSETDSCDESMSNIETSLQPIISMNSSDAAPMIINNNASVSTDNASSVPGPIIQNVYSSSQLYATSLIPSNLFESTTNAKFSTDKPNQATSSSPSPLNTNEFGRSKPIYPVNLISINPSKSHKKPFLTESQQDKNMIKFLRKELQQSEKTIAATQAQVQELLAVNILLSKQINPWCKCTK